MIEKSAAAPSRATITKPILVSGAEARRLIGVQRTKYHALVSAGKIETVFVGNRRMVVFASLERLAETTNAAA